MPTLARLTLYPFKSLDGQPLDEATILPSGAIQDDRRYAFVDAAGRYFNAKRCEELQTVRSAVDLPRQLLELATPHDVTTFSLVEDRDEVERYFSILVGAQARLIENITHGFPDDTDSPGPTVVSTATLQAIAGWFDLPLDEVRRRFRANIEIDGVEPFWEDRLVAEAGVAVPFTIGNVRFEGMNPCQRCPVPSRDSYTGVAISGFAKSFAQRREQSLPSWATRSRFNHFYRLAVNTRLGGSGGVIAVGDKVVLSIP